jgi:hypothetical protein
LADHESDDQKKGTADPLNHIVPATPVSSPLASAADLSARHDSQLKKAQKQINRALLCTWVRGLGLLLLYLTQAHAKSSLIFIEPLLILALAFFLFRKNRMAAIIIFSYACFGYILILSQALMLKGHPRGLGISGIFLYFHWGGYSRNF